MCNIIGYVVAKHAAKLWLRDSKMEYRGYDSAWIAGLNNGEFTLKKEVVPFRNLFDFINDFSKVRNIGIGNIRWTAYNGVSAKNVHQHISSRGSFAIVHKGVIENYE